MSFRDPEQFDHMRRGVRAALQSPNTPTHLRPHLAARLTGGFPKMPAANPLGNPMQMAAQALKGADLMKPIKTVVSTGGQKPIKTVVGSTAAPPRKSMPGSYGRGNKPLPLGLSRPPNSAAGPRATRNPIGKDGNPGKSTSPMPAAASGPPNPVLDNTKSSGASQIVSGGMGQTGKRPKRGAFFGN